MKPSQKGFSSVLMLAIVGLIALGSATFYYAHKSKDIASEGTPSVAQNKPISQSEDDTPDLKCTQVEKEDAGTRETVYYLSAKNYAMRRDITVTTSKGSIKTNILNVGGYQYEWPKEFGEYTGGKGRSEYKGDIATYSRMVQNPIQQDNFSFTCTSWEYDEGLMTPPSDIRFREF